MVRFRVNWHSNGTEISRCFENYWDALGCYNTMRMGSRYCVLTDEEKGVLRKTYMEKMEDNIHWERKEIVND